MAQAVLHTLPSLHPATAGSMRGWTQLHGMPAPAVLRLAWHHVCSCSRHRDHGRCRGCDPGQAAQGTQPCAGPSELPFHRAHSVVRHKTNGTMRDVTPVDPAGAQDARNEMVILLCEKLLAADAMPTCKLTEKPRLRLILRCKILLATNGTLTCKLTVE